MEASTTLEARRYLDWFVAEATHAPPIESYEELQDIIRPEIAASLHCLILNEGQEPRRHAPEVMSVLRSSPLSKNMIQGTVQTDATQEPYVLLEDLQRQPLRMKRVGWASVHNGLHTAGAAGDQEGYYIPFFLKGKHTRFLEHEFSTLLPSPELNPTLQGLEVPGEARRRATFVMNGFLQVTARLTQRLLEIDT